MRGVPFASPPVEWAVSTDASLMGWGGAWGTRQVSGLWPPHFRGLHINVLELYAVWESLKAFRLDLQGKTVLIKTDNTTVVAYVNREGGTHSRTLNALAWQVLTWCDDLQIVPPAGGGSTHTGTPMPSGSQVPASGCVENIRLGLRQKGLSLLAAQLTSGSRRISTVVNYNERLAKFKAWCAIRDVSPSSSPLPAVADFLTTLFDEGLQVNTIRNYCSTISAIHQGFEDGSSVGDNSALAQLIKAMSIQRPIQRVLAPSWSMNAVLRTLADAPYEPLHKASLEHLSV